MSCAARTMLLDRDPVPEAFPASASDVALVIPARDAAATLDACLSAVVPLLGRELDEIVVVDDGSRDATAAIAARYPVRCLRGRGEGPSAARNRGWRATSARRIWFVDADCVAEPEALPKLVARLDATGAAGAGGSYANASPESWLATLIDDEIALRHAAMGEQVDYLATFNVLYERDALEKVGGFDEALVRAEDVDLAWRVLRAGGQLAFDASSRVAHFHERRLAGYLRTQAANGYWRAWLYGMHPAHASGDSYSNGLDHLQPPLALATVVAAGAAPWLGLAPGALGLAATSALQLPFAAKIARRRGRSAAARFVAVGVLRSLARGLGLARGVAAVALARRRARADASGQ